MPSKRTPEAYKPFELRMDPAKQKQASALLRVLFVAATEMDTSVETWNKLHALITNSELTATFTDDQKSLLGMIRRDLLRAFTEASHASEEKADILFQSVEQEVLKDGSIPQHLCEEAKYFQDAEHLLCERTWKKLMRLMGQALP